MSKDNDFERAKRLLSECPNGINVKMLRNSGEEITYKVIDESGNEVLFTRTVIVKDNSSVIWLVVSVLAILVGSIGYILVKKRRKIIL